ncbi:hypothetical protein [Listeria sp. PSOL-1]|uniref:hypothetical protein n=1 Tax=Listeria sp. PSOL-1 TaxID=1844999 RepID=UPI0013D321C2|nr:hypothetical protein [Listeria sp. PSOL-1]
MYVHMITKRADNEINKVIHKSGIPQDEIIAIKNIKCHIPPFAYGHEWFSKTITTKKDYANWQKWVKEKNILLMDSR